MTSKQPQVLATDTPRPNHSTGPTTPEGKRVCSLNAVRHGLTGQFYIFTPEEQQAFDNYCKIIHQALAPVGDFERIVVQSSFPLFDRSIAADRWRLERARAIESGMFALGMRQHLTEATGNPEVDGAFAQALTWHWDANKLQLLTVYEQRIQRACDKNMAQLETLQAARKEEAKEATRQARLVYQLAEAEGKTYESKENFITVPEAGESVCSTAEVAHEVSRVKLFKDAETYHGSGRLPVAEPSLCETAVRAPTETCETDRTRVT